MCFKKFPLGSFSHLPFNLPSYTAAASWRIIGNFYMFQCEEDINDPQSGIVASELCLSPWNAYS